MMENLRQWMGKHFHFKENTEDNYRLCLESLLESTEELKNPGCGWYQIYSFYANQKPNVNELDWYTHEKDSLVLVICNISAYREQELDAQALEHVQQVLEAFHQKNKDIILRITYDNEGKGLIKEPSLFRLVCTHARQMVPVLEQYKNRIYIFQGLLVGSWGEMHGSKFLKTENLKELLDILREPLGEDAFLAVRRPMYYRRLEKTIRKSGKLALFDDGIFGSPTHLGTFGEQSKKAAGWDNAWNTTDEYAFIEELCTYVPIGGETVLGTQERYELSLKETVQKLEQLHISYLNRAYDERVLGAWKSMHWLKMDDWRQMDGRKYIGRHLGYRFVVKGAKLSAQTKEKKEQLCLTVTIANVGFSNCYQRVHLYLRLENKEEISFQEDLRTLGSNKTMECQVLLPVREERLWLGIRRVWDNQPILFGNKYEEDELYLGQIKCLL